MAKKKNLKEEEIKTQEELQQEKAQQDNLQKIDPVTSSDEDMPEPKTKSYDQYLVLSDTFMNLVQTCFGNMPYNSVFHNNIGQQMKMSDLMTYLDKNRLHCGINEMNQCITFMASAPYNKVKPLMEYIEDNKKQEELWKIVQD